MSTHDLPDLLDADLLIELGHSEDATKWLLRHAIRGPAHEPFLSLDEYERLLPDLKRWLEGGGRP